MDEKRLLSQIAQTMEQALEAQTQKMEELSKAQTRKIEILIENKVTKRIDGLMDGYKLTHEKQYELERKADLLQQQIDAMQARLYALEKKTAS